MCNLTITIKLNTVIKMFKFTLFKVWLAVNGFVYSCPFGLDGCRQSNVRINICISVSFNVRSYRKDHLRRFVNSCFSVVIICSWKFLVFLSLTKGRTKHSGRIGTIILDCSLNVLPFIFS